MMRAIFSGLVLALLAIPLGVSRADEKSEAVIDTTIKAIHANPWAFSGKRVRLVATFDECVSLTCQVCDGAEPPAEEKSCAGVDLALERGATSGLRETLDPNFGSYLVRFATAQIEATYSAVCSGETSPDGSIFVCSDNATELLDVEVDAVLIRRPATEGQLSMYGDELVTAASVDEARLIRAAYDGAVVAKDRKSAPEDFVFLVQPNPETSEGGTITEGGLCRCIADQCKPDDWPTRLGHVSFLTPANPYQCWIAVRNEGRWRFSIR